MSYICSSCNSFFPSFQITCPDCGRWNSLRKQTVVISKDSEQPISLPKIESFSVPRIRTRIDQLDLLLGDGFVPGSTVLLTGQPGAGKSTLLMQVLKKMNIPSLYVTGEESVQQLKLRADRLRITSPNILVLFESNISAILAHVNQTKIRMLVVDSIQTIYSDTMTSLPGSSMQIRKCIYVLRRIAQQQNLVLIIVGQVTKNRTTAGPKLLEHAVDVVFHLDVQEDQGHHRILYASKNRFGSTAPRCLLYMRKTGLVFHGVKA
jgi:DNA repair protein RadA/Sms